MFPIEFEKYLLANYIGDYSGYNLRNSRFDDLYDFPAVELIYILSNHRCFHNL